MKKPGRTLRPAGARRIRTGTIEALHTYRNVRLNGKTGVIARRTGVYRITLREPGAPVLLVDSTGETRWIGKRITDDNED